MWDDHGSHVEELIALPGGSRGGARRFRGSGQAATRQTHHPLTEVEIACGQPKVKLTRMPDLDRGVDFAYFVPTAANDPKRTFAYRGWRAYA